MKFKARNGTKNQNMNSENRPAGSNHKLHVEGNSMLKPDNNDDFDENDEADGDDFDDEIQG